MTSSQIQLARRRLGLGISNVGLWVVASGLMLWIARNEADLLNPSTLILLGGGLFAVQTAFDFLGGVTFLPSHSRSLSSVVQGWAVGVASHSLILIGIGFVCALSLHFTGGFYASIVLLTVFLTLMRKQLAFLIGGVSTSASVKNEEILIAAVGHEPAFTGGLVGFGRLAKNVMPAEWERNLSKEDLETESWRRQWQINSGLPARTLVLILAWNLFGAMLGDLAFSFSDRAAPVALLSYGCWMTLWAFVSLLVLPVLSQGIVFAADRACFESGRDPRAWISRFADLIGEDGNSKSAIQAIFYPIPSVRMRQEKVLQPFLRFAFGSLARSNLYYSLATFTPLGRTVHCNVGRPALWVFPPVA